MRAVSRRTLGIGWRLLRHVVPCAGGAVVLVLLTGVTVAPVAAGSPASPAKTVRASSSGPLYTWFEGERRVSARLSSQEVAVFAHPATRRGESAPRLFRVTKRAGEKAEATFERVRRRLLSDRAVARIGAVLYRGAPARENRLITTGELIVCFRDGVGDAERRTLLAAQGLKVVRGFGFAPSALLARSASPLGVFAAAEALRESSRVAWTSPSFFRVRATRALPNDLLFSRQWHLLSTGALGGLPGLDLRVTPAWDVVRGSNQVIAVVDDGIEVAHADLAPNVVPNASYDWVDGDRDPTPQDDEESGWYEWHGTACAGVAAARGFNGLGVAGVAPHAGLVGYRFMAADSDTVEAEALGNTRAGVFDNRELVAVCSSSWGPYDDRRLEAPGPLTLAALEAGVRTGRGGKGTVYVWAAGNGRENDDNVNFDGYANSRYTIAVGAVGANGKVAPYSEGGAPLMVCAPSGGGGLDIVTTDRVGFSGYSSGSYTGSFSGTSAAAPQVAGVVALLLEANPELSWRDVQQILMTTARKVDATSSSWTRNAAGYHVSHIYGFGLVDAAAAVAAAKTWSPVARESLVEASTEPNAPIPDDAAASVSSTITLGSEQALRVEYVEVDLSVLHNYWSDLEISLTGPSGTYSRLATASPFASFGGLDYSSSWRFGSARHLGESSCGAWTLKIRDRQAGDSGTFVRWTLRVHGTRLGRDRSAPQTSVSGTSGRWWHTAPTFSLHAVDLGSNVRSTEYRIDGTEGDPFVEGTTVTVEAPANHANDGPHTIWYRSTDNVGNVESAKSCVVHVDTQRPRSTAPRAARVVRGAVTRLYYRVTDAGYCSGQASVTIRIRDLRGRLRQTISVPAQPVSRTKYVAYRCRLSRGVYRFAVSARDSAGNVQSHAAVNTLTVR